MLQAGSFGGGYFRDITSSVTKTTYKDAWKELPDDWLEGLDIKTQVASQTYRTSINRYGVNCGVKTDKSDSFGLKAGKVQDGWPPRTPTGGSSGTAGSSRVEGQMMMKDSSAGG